jgi:outer membrane protein assembly factor BamB
LAGFVPDIWGGDRTELKERYANSMLAINASTGKLVWNFQTSITCFRQYIDCRNSLAGFVFDIS